MGVLLALKLIQCRVTKNLGAFALDPYMPSFRDAFIAATGPIPIYDECFARWSRVRSYGLHLETLGPLFVRVMVRDMGCRDCRRDSSALAKDISQSALSGLVKDPSEMMYLP